MSSSLDAENVVTSLHVVDNSEQITVYYPTLKLSRKAKIQKVLKGADLALLKVIDHPDVPPLNHDSTIPQFGDEITAFGFPLNVRAVGSFDFTVRYGGNRLKDNLPTKALNRIKDNGYPNENTEIVKLDRNSLMPGLSGAPLVNSEGKVVAIGDGGLEMGALNMSWGIPAVMLDSLLLSRQANAPRSGKVRELFAAELMASFGQTITIGNTNLTKVRTRTFDQIAKSAPNTQYLDEFINRLNDFDRIDPSRYIFDIYQDFDSGATVVVPEGTQFTMGMKPNLFHSYAAVTKPSAPRIGMETPEYVWGIRDGWRPVRENTLINTDNTVTLSIQYSTLSVIIRFIRKNTNEEIKVEIQKFINEEKPIEDTSKRITADLVFQPPARIGEKYTEYS